MQDGTSRRTSSQLFPPFSAGRCGPASRNSSNRWRRQPSSRFARRLHIVLPSLPRARAQRMSTFTEGSQLVAIAGQSKLTKEHWKRLACVYVRQSTLKQVQHNRESQVNQYQLVERAEVLGWARERIHVIDADLVRSEE